MNPQGCVEVHKHEKLTKYSAIAVIGRSTGVRVSQRDLPSTDRKSTEKRFSFNGWSGIHKTVSTRDLTDYPNDVLFIDILLITFS